MTLHNDSSATIVAYICMLAVSILLPLNDMVIKIVGQNVPPPQIAFMRFCLQIILLAPFAFAVSSKRSGPTVDLKIEFARGALLGTTTLFFFLSLKLMPLAEATALFFVEPLLLTGMAAVFLHESIGWRRICAIFIAFFGVLLMMSPQFSLIGWPAIFPLVAATSFAGYQLVTRFAGGRYHFVNMQFFSGIFAALLLALVLTFGLIADIKILIPILPKMEDLWLIGFIGINATIAHILIVLAFNRAKASELAPLGYFSLVNATILSIIVFNHTPDNMSWLGIVLIVASGLFTMWRKRQAD